MLDKAYILNTLEKCHDLDYDESIRLKALIESHNEFNIKVIENPVTEELSNVIEVVENGNSNLVILRIIEQEDGTVKVA